MVNDRVAELECSEAQLKHSAESAEAKLAAVREIAEKHYADPTYARDDHSQNCRWCRVLKILEIK